MLKIPHPQIVMQSPQSQRRSLTAGTPVTPAGSDSRSFFPEADSLMALGQYHQQTGSPVMISFSSPGPSSHRTPNYGGVQTSGGSPGSFTYTGYQQDPSPPVHSAYGAHPGGQYGGGNEGAINYSHQGQGGQPLTYYGATGSHHKNPGDTRGKQHDQEGAKDLSQSHPKGN